MASRITTQRTANAAESRGPITQAPRTAPSIDADIRAPACGTVKPFANAIARRTAAERRKRSSKGRQRTLEIGRRHEPGSSSVARRLPMQMPPTADRVRLPHQQSRRSPAAETARSGRRCKRGIGRRQAGASIEAGVRLVCFQECRSSGRCNAGVPQAKAQAGASVGSPDGCLCGNPVRLGTRWRRMITTASAVLSQLN
jgi:hypothetical protein